MNKYSFDKDYNVVCGKVLCKHYYIKPNCHIALLIYLYCLICNVDTILYCKCETLHNMSHHLFKGFVSISFKTCLYVFSQENSGATLLMIEFICINVTQHLYV